jgi:hypothetical protein
MNGMAIRNRPPMPRPTWSRIFASLEARDVPAETVEEDVLLPPQHAFRHPGRPARVEHVEVVGRVGEVQRLRRLGGEQLLVVERAGKRALLRAVRDVDQRLDRAQARQHGAELRRERPMVDDGAGARASEHVLELGLDVAVVDVDRDGARLEGAHQRLEVFVAVVEVERDVVLARLPGLEPLALDAAAVAEPREGAAEAAAAGVQLGVGEAAVAPDERLAVGDRAGDQVLDGGEVNEHLPALERGELNGL